MKNTTAELLSAYYSAGKAGRKRACLELYRRLKDALDLLDTARVLDEPEAIEAALSILETGK